MSLNRDTSEKVDVDVEEGAVGERRLNAKVRDSFTGM